MLLHNGKYLRTVNGYVWVIKLVPYLHAVCGCWLKWVQVELLWKYEIHNSAKTVRFLRNLRNYHCNCLAGGS